MSMQGYKIHMIRGSLCFYRVCIAHVQCTCRSVKFLMYGHFHVWLE